MEWFDCHAEIGRRAVPGPLQAPDAAALASLYNEIGIKRALVVHSSMYEIHAFTGNARMLKEVADYPQFSPTWAILPPVTEELRDADHFLTGMRHAGVRALWGFPTGYAINASTFGSLYEEMVARHIPLFVKVSAVGWPAITALLADVRRLKVVAILPSVWGEDRYFRPLIEHYSGFHLCTSMYLLEGGVKAFVDKYGPFQLLFGSSFPDCQPGGSYFSLLNAGLKEEDLVAIAGGNLRHLLEEVRL